MGASVALVSFDRGQIGAMSCNPAMGGLGKGHLIREVDAFDGLIARASDHAAIHYRMLNASKGAAVRGPRVQADRRRYKAAIHALIDEQEGLTVVEGEASALRLEGRRVTGLALADGRLLGADAVILATGTFLGGKLHFGMSSRAGGRVGERAATALADQLDRAEAAACPPEDGHPAAPRWPHDRLGWPRAPAFGRWRLDDVADERRPRRAAAFLRHHAHKPPNPRHYPRQSRSFASVCGRNRRGWAALLPLYRG